MVGSVLTAPAKALQGDLALFLQGEAAALHGAVYVNMGTLAVLSEDELCSFAAAFSKLPHPVVWKLAAHDLPGHHQHALALTLYCLPDVLDCVVSSLEAQLAVLGMLLLYTV